MAAQAQVIIKVVEWLGKAIIDAQVRWMEFEKHVNQSLRSVGYTGEQLRGINNRLIEDTVRMGRLYGASHDELVKIHQQYTQITKTAALLSSQTMETQYALGRLVGESNVVKWEESMRKFGMHAKASQAWLGKAQIEAKKLGLNAEQFASDLAQSASLMQKMTFSSGINGLQKMTALATRLGTSLSSMTAAIDIDSGKFSTIEGAIETAAGLQRLGGSFGAEFANPMAVMAEGMFDAEAFTERLARAVEGKGTFNRATGMVDMGWYDKKSLGLMAQQLGMSPDEVRTMANRATMGNAIEADMRASGAIAKFDQTQIDAIKNLAEFDPDQQKWLINYQDKYGNEYQADVNTLTPGELELIQGLTKEEKTIDQNVATIAGKVNLIADVIRGKAEDTSSSLEVIQGLKNSKDAWLSSWFDGGFVGGIKNFIQHPIDSIFGHENGGIIQPSPTGLEGVQKFASGGLVSGNSYSGDRVLTRLNSGEMVLNKSQQANLFNMANTKSQAGIVGMQTLALSQTPKALEATGKLLNSTGKAIENSANLVKGTFKLIPTTSKELKNSFKLLKSTGKAMLESKVVGMPGVGFLNNRNLAGRYLRSKLYQIDPRLSKGFEQASHLYGKAKSAVAKPVKWVGGKVAQGATWVGEGAKWVGEKTAQGARWVGEKTVKGASSAANRIANSRVGQGVQTLAQNIASKGRTVATNAKQLGTRVLNTRAVQGINSVAQNVMTKGRGAVVGAKMQMELLKSSKFAQNISEAATKFASSTRAFGSRVGDFAKGARDIAKSGAGKMTKTASNVARTTGNVAKAATQGALKYGGKAVQGIGQLASRTGAAMSKATSAVSKGASRVAIKTLGKSGAKALGKAIPGLGSALTVGFAAVDGFNAIKDFSKTKESIQSRTDLSNKEKKQLLREAEDQRNEKIGGAVGAVAGTAIGAALGGPVGAAIGGFIGEKVGGFIGKSVNTMKDFLFGKEAELSEEEQAQLDYEESKFGQVGIEDPQLMEKAAMATCAMHDLLISIWHHMNGRASNGEEIDEGFIKSSLKGVTSIAKGVVGAATSVVTAPFKAVGNVMSSLFGKKDEKEEKEKSETEVLTEGSFEDVVKSNIVNINSNVEALLANKKQGGKGIIAKLGGAALTALNPLGALGMGIAKKFLVGKNDDTKIEPKPLGEDAVKVENNGENSTQETVNNIDNTPSNIKLEISGTLKLEGNGVSKDLDVMSLFNDMKNKEALVNMIMTELNRRNTGGPINKNNRMGQRQTVNAF